LIHAACALECRASAPRLASGKRAHVSTPRRKSVSPESGTEWHVAAGIRMHKNPFRRINNLSSSRETNCLALLLILIKRFTE
jgi:hypothetical protein